MGKYFISFVENIFCYSDEILIDGRNWEFEMYINNRTNSYVKEQTLYIRPTLLRIAMVLMLSVVPHLPQWSYGVELLLIYVLPRRSTVAHVLVVEVM